MLSERFPDSFWHSRKLACNKQFSIDALFPDLGCFFEILIHLSKPRSFLNYGLIKALPQNLSQWPSSWLASKISKNMFLISIKIFISRRVIFRYQCNKNDHWHHFAPFEFMTWMWMYKYINWHLKCSMNQTRSYAIHSITGCCYLYSRSCFWCCCSCRFYCLLALDLA